MDLCRLVLEAGCRSLCIVGTAKNAGKTTVFNYLCREAAAAGVVLGLMSTGRDGEATDLVTGEPKPAVAVPVGALLATAERALTASDVYAEILEVLPLETLFGSITVGRVHEAGQVELVGPEHAAGVRQVMGALFRQGAGMVLVDGSIDRRAAAAPAVTGNVVLVTGAALGPDLPAVVDRTSLWLEYFGLGAVSDPLLARPAARAVTERAVTLLEHSGRVRPLRLRTALDAAAAVSAAAGSQTAAVVLGGALTDALLAALMSRPQPLPPPVIVNDATRVFTSRRVYHRYLRAGGRVEVVSPIRVLAVAANPIGPGAGGHDPVVMVKSIARVARGLPVFDVVTGFWEKGGDGRGPQPDVAAHSGGAGV